MTENKMSVASKLEFIINLYETKVMGPKGRLRRLIKKKDLRKLLKLLNKEV